jgi:hypothetical protein
MTNPSIIIQQKVELLRDEIFTLLSTCEQMPFVPIEPVASKIHTCDSKCAYITSKTQVQPVCPSQWICKTSGNMHYCSHTCEYIIKHTDVLCCELTGSTYPLEYVYNPHTDFHLMNRVTDDDCEDHVSDLTQGESEERGGLEAVLDRGASSESHDLDGKHNNGCREAKTTASRKRKRREEDVFTKYMQKKTRLSDITEKICKSGLTIEETTWFDDSFRGVLSVLRSDDDLINDTVEMLSALSVFVLFHLSINGFMCKQITILKYPSIFQKVKSIRQIRKEEDAVEKQKSIRMYTGHCDFCPKYRHYEAIFLSRLNKITACENKPDFTQSRVVDQTIPKNRKRADLMRVSALFGPKT